MPSNEPQDGRCGSKLRGKPGWFCDKFPSKGRSRCELHGGKNPVGEANPAFKTGRHSRVLPIQAAARYGELMTDPTMVSLGQEISLVDLMIEESLAALYGGEQATPELFRALRTHWDALVTARAKADVATMTEQMEAIGEIIENGAERARHQDRVLSLIDKRKGLVVAERRRLTDEEYSIPVDAFLATIGTLMRLINQLFDDQNAKRELLRRVEQMVGQGGLRLMPPAATADG